MFDPAVGAPGTEGFDFQSGLSVFSTGPLSAGNYVLGFAVVDDFDSLGRSGLLIGNVQLGTVSQQIPEPSTVLGSLIAIASIGFATYKRKQTKKSPTR